MRTEQKQEAGQKTILKKSVKTREQYKRSEKSDEKP